MLSDSLPDVHEALREELVRFGADPERVTSDANLFTDLGLDSLELTTALLEVEDRFGVDISDQASSIETVGDAVRIIYETFDGQRTNE
jgi:acyl carrier protein